MLLVHFGKELSGWPGRAGFHVFMPSADTFNGFLEILALPLQIGRQSFIERCSRVLAVSLGVFLQLRLALGSKGNHIHGAVPARIDTPSVRRESLCQGRLSISSSVFFRSTPQR
jgi:hypothetical protein